MPKPPDSEARNRLQTSPSISRTPQDEFRFEDYFDLESFLREQELEGNCFTSRPTNQHLDSNQSDIHSPPGYSHTQPPQVANSLSNTGSGSELGANLCDSAVLSSCTPETNTPTWETQHPSAEIPTVQLPGNSLPAASQHVHNPCSEDLPSFAWEQLLEALKYPTPIAPAPLPDTQAKSDPSRVASPPPADITFVLAIWASAESPGTTISQNLSVQVLEKALHVFDS
ncbi:hypothetical protein MKZ38_003928 [Zalerion maritima]|uniref:Uncharacterized protein n=1 Tax=Zalerion maritima TaxID=339359 RepID=A0AAD5RNH6_9PEZI|nr:hypothetical protein MKZ38_003928 [Zalerion maritima]